MSGRLRQVLLYTVHSPNNENNKEHGSWLSDPESLVRGGPTLTSVFRRKRRSKQIPLKAGHHRPASETPFKWRFAGDNGPKFNTGLVALCFFQGMRTPNIFVIFQGGPDPMSPFGSAHGSCSNGIPTICLNSLEQRGSSKSARAWISIIFCMLNTYVITTQKWNYFIHRRLLGYRGHLDVHPLCTSIWPIKYQSKIINIIDCYIFWTEYERRLPRVYLTTINEYEYI